MVKGILVVVRGILFSVKGILISVRGILISVRGILISVTETNWNTVRWNRREKMKCRRWQNFNQIGAEMQAFA